MGTRRRLSRFAVAIICLGLVALLTGCGPRVPDVKGKSADEAVRVLEKAGYRLGTVVQLYTPGLPPDTVADQNPAGGDRAREGTKVDLTIAKALGALSVPDLTGMTEAQALDKLGSNQMTGTPVAQYSDTVPVNTVFEQVPAAGAKVDVGAEVVFAISKGKAPATVKVPSLVKSTQADADAALKKAGLEGTPYSAYNDTYAAGIVAGQDPAAGASVKPGSKVAYVVSLGKQPTGGGDVTVPNVKGKSQADAEAAINSAGLTPSAVSDTNAAAKGTVAGQMPPGGSKTAKGGVVGILVSLGPEAQVAVPDLKGMTADAAKAAVTGVGMIPYPVEQPSADVPKGQVFGQQPPAGQKVPAGWPVLYAVSSGVPAATTSP